MWIARRRKRNSLSGGGLRAVSPWLRYSCTKKAQPLTGMWPSSFRTLMILTVLKDWDLADLPASDQVAGTYTPWRQKLWGGFNVEPACPRLAPSIPSWRRRKFRISWRKCPTETIWRTLRGSQLNVARWPDRLLAGRYNLAGLLTSCPAAADIRRLPALPFPQPRTFVMLQPCIVGKGTHRWLWELRSGRSGDAEEQ